MNEQTDEVIKDNESASGAATLATGGGNATAAGVTFQGAVGALFAATAVADRPLDARFGIGAVRIKELRFEAEAPLDDIMIATDADGYVFTQVKTSLTLAKKLDSELGKTAEQIVRQWIACSGGDGSLAWNRPVVAGRDSFLIAVGPGATGTVAKDLAQGLSRRRRKATDETTPADEKKALETFTALLQLAWEEVVGSHATAEDIVRLLDFTAIVQFDTNGADRNVAVEILRSALLQPDDAPSAFDVLGSICEKHMAERTGADPQALRRDLEQKPIRLLAPPDYRADVEAFRAFSKTNQEYLAAFEVIHVDGKDVGLRREDSSIDFLSCSIEKPSSHAREERGRFGRNSQSSSQAIGSVSTNQPAWAVGSWKCAYSLALAAWNLAWSWSISIFAADAAFLKPGSESISLVTSL